METLIDIDKTFKKYARISIEIQDKVFKSGFKVFKILTICAVLAMSPIKLVSGTFHLGSIFEDILYMIFVYFLSISVICIVTICIKRHFAIRKEILSESDK